jgi:hypothetical protein
MQGNQVVGSSVMGCAASGQTAAIGFFFSGGSNMPAWDSNQVGEAGGPSLLAGNMRACRRCFTPALWACTE